MSQLEKLLTKYKVQPVGIGYIDCIVMMDNFEDFIKEIPSLGILITDVSINLVLAQKSVKGVECKKVSFYSTGTIVKH